MNGLLDRLRAQILSNVTSGNVEVAAIEEIQRLNRVVKELMDINYTLQESLRNTTTTKEVK